jgi:hypothetical protein
MVNELLLAWAIVATLLALWAWWRSEHWRRSYLASLRLIPAMHLMPPPAKTPHQRGAETRRRRTIEAMRERRLAMEAAIGREADDA